MNAAKADIDHLNQQLESKKQQAANTAAAAGSTGGEPGVLDDEHYQLLQQLKAAKARWVVAGWAKKDSMLALPAPCIMFTL